MKRARWWMRRRWWPRTFAEYMATPEKIGQRDAILAMCDLVQMRIDPLPPVAVTETPAEARKWLRRGGYCVAFGVLLEAYAGADVVWSVLTSHVTPFLAMNVITVACGIICVNRGLTIRQAWLWALPLRRGRCNRPSQPASAHPRPSGSRSR